MQGQLPLQDPDRVDVQLSKLGVGHELRRLRAKGRAQLPRQGPAPQRHRARGRNALLLLATMSYVTVGPCPDLL
jgi:hypothetical protein